MAALLLMPAGLAASQDSIPKISLNPNELVRRVVAKEVESAKQPAYYRFRFRRETERGVFVGERILTKEGGISRTMTISGQPLSEEQRRQWEQGAQKLATDRELRAKRLRELRQDQKRITNLVRALPEAFVYEFDGREPGSGWVRLKFRPNPKFGPPSTETRALRGMAGTMWVDVAAERMARFDGVLVEDVDFGWGLLGKLYRGGQVTMENTRLLDGSWRTSALTLQLRGRVLFIKSFSVDRKDRFSQFERVPDNFTVAQAVERLRRLELVTCSEKRPANGFCAD